MRQLMVKPNAEDQFVKISQLLLPLNNILQVTSGDDVYFIKEYNQHFDQGVE